MPELLTMSSLSVKDPDKSDRKTHRLNKESDRRFLIFAAVIVIMLLAIATRTAMLQLSEERVQGVVESSGEQRQMIVPAPRGDIVDASGIPLAYSEKTRALYYADAGLDSARLNRVLFDLSELLLSDGVAYRGNLTTYFDLSQASRENPAAEVTFVFRSDLDDILRWQKHRDLFALVDADEASPSLSNAVKTDPREFFEYLLYDFFEIEVREAGKSRRYSDREAFRIMELRYTLLENNWYFKTGNPILIAGDVSHRLEQIIFDQSFKYPGALIEDNYSRRYSAFADYAGHAIGYIGAISASEYEEMKRFGYQMNAVVGKSGVERSAERYLRGVDGLRSYLLFVDDKTQTPTDSGRQPEAGNEVRLTLDIGLQQTAKEAMQNTMETLRALPIINVKAKSGSFVALNPKTGGIYAIGAIPDYKVSDFVNQTVDQNAAARVESYLTDLETKPMLNRAISENYSPGSTFKPFTSIAALESGTVTAGNNTFTCGGTEEIGGWVWRCLQQPDHGHGPLTMQEGLMTSCNLYFYHLGIATGIDNISPCLKKFGLGELTGVDLPGEVAGIRPSREMKALLRTLPEDKEWFIADTCQTSIGQFDNSYTMLQMARGIAGLATGYLTRPHVIGDIVGADGIVVREEQIERIPLDLDPAHMQVIREGMMMMARGGSIRVSMLFSDFPIPVAAKTGTAQVGYGKEQTTNSVFVCYAPADDPQIVLAYVVEDGSFGDRIADVAYYILCDFFDIEPRELPPITVIP